MTTGEGNDQDQDQERSLVAEVEVDLGTGANLDQGIGSGRGQEGGTGDEIDGGILAPRPVESAGEKEIGRMKSMAVTKRSNQSGSLPGRNAWPN
mmetsp:Transcript_4507/g.8205  ORF Transcript_4507/g.8205 Transcript_4507/m.8205 type:complete len:94 (+) Transcript_4507:859-1140(+)